MPTPGYLYPGEGNPSSGKLRDPLVLAPSGATITLDSNVNIVANDNNAPWLTEALGQEWLTEVEGQPWLTESGFALAVFNLPDARTGSLSISGAGTITVSGEEGAARQVVVTGGGVPVFVVTGDHFGTTAITGGGALVVTGSEGSLLQIVVTGGGQLVSTGQKAATASIAITGGGQVTVTSPSEAQPAPAVAGRFYYPPQKYGRVRISGGGDIEVEGEKGAFELVLVHGNGRLRVRGYKRYPVQLGALIKTALAA